MGGGGMFGRNKGDAKASSSNNNDDDGEAGAKFEVLKKGTWLAPSAKDIARAEPLLEAIEAADERMAQKLKREEDGAMRGQVAALSIEDVRGKIAMREADAATILAELDVPAPPADAPARYEAANRALISAKKQLGWERREARQAVATFDAEAERAVDVGQDLEAARRAFADAGFRLVRDGIKSAAHEQRLAAIAASVQARRGPASASSSASSSAAPASLNRRPTITRTKGGALEKPT